jgi:hypothetical protein
LRDFVHGVDAIDRSASLAPIANERGSESNATNLNRGKADLNCELSAITVAAREVKSVAHLTRSRRIKVVPKVGRVRLMARGWNQYLYRFAY